MKKERKSIIKRPCKEKMRHAPGLLTAEKYKISLTACVRPEVLAETLRKPERVYNRAFKGIPKLHGRVAWSLPVYRAKVNEKLRSLRVDMAAVCRQDPEWLRLRKQEIALLDRIDRRNKTEGCVNAIKQHQEYLIGALQAAQDHTTEDVFAEIVNETKDSLPVLSEILDATFSKIKIGSCSVSSETRID